MINFSDGVNLDTEGEYRVIHLKDGYYVIGHGLLCPVDSQLEGEQVIEEFKRLTIGAQNEDRSEVQP
jgi:hypothetical protein